jgi:hypothetical protein
MTQRIKVMGLALMAMFAIAGVATATANAENPLLLLLTGEALPVTTSASGGAAKLVTSAGEISATAVSESGECVEDGNGTIDTRTCKGTLKFTGAKSGAAKCKTTGANAEELVIPVEVHVVDILVAGVLSLGLLFLLTSTISINCGVGLTIEVRGSAIGHVLSAENGVENAATVKKTVQFRGVSGVQEFKTCDLTKARCEGKTFFLEAAFTAGAFKEAVQTAEAELSLGKMWTADF